MATKQELLHLYGLIEEVRYEYEEGQGESLENLLEGYEQPDLHTTEIHRSKTDYKEALLIVADGLGTAMEKNEDISRHPGEQYNVSSGPGRAD